MTPAPGQRAAGRPGDGLQRRVHAGGGAGAGDDFRRYGLRGPHNRVRVHDPTSTMTVTQEEYDRIVALLKREPTETQLGIFSAMWSEHCSYKSSRIHLKKLPTTGRRVLQGPGENAGAVDIGGGLAAVFKIESHNHPSFIEPYPGPATGVGGITRDIFPIRAPPIPLPHPPRLPPLDGA